MFQKFKKKENGINRKKSFSKEEEEKMLYIYVTAHSKAATFFLMKLNTHIYIKNIHVQYKRSHIGYYPPLCVLSFAL